MPKLQQYMAECKRGHRVRLPPAMLETYCCDPRCTNCGVRGCARASIGALNRKDAMQICCMTSSSVVAYRQASGRPTYCQDAEDTSCVVQRLSTGRQQSVPPPPPALPKHRGWNASLAWRNKLARRPSTSTNVRVEDHDGHPLIARKLLRNQAVFWLSSLSVPGSVRPCPLADRMKTLPVPALISTPEVLVPGPGANWDCPRGECTDGDSMGREL